ncbi:MAG: hypothetical protein IT432_06465 [Phycisphaerales bacterium]|nr:hypothetical protein [Phycisphaerales bacterium]
MKSPEFGGIRGGWTLPRITGLLVGLACVSIGLMNAGVVGNTQAPSRVDVSDISGANTHELARAAVAPGLAVATEESDATRAGPRRNVPRDFSIIFAAAASPDESDASILMADTNFDGVVDGSDVEQFVEAIESAIEQAARTGYGGFSARYDLNDDGRLDQQDLGLYFDAFGFGEDGPRFKGVHLVKC